jgi:hypothetical protein
MAVMPQAPAARRPLHLPNLDALGSELERTEAAEQSGELEAVGNWTPGQILGHLAAWTDYGWEGYPMKAPSLPIRWFLRWSLPKMLKAGMPGGVRIPGVPGGTVGIEELPFDEGLARLRRSLVRLKSNDPPTHHSPAFGEMSLDDRILLNLRHAELHLGYLRYPGEEAV